MHYGSRDVIGLKFCQEIGGVWSSEVIHAAMEFLCSHAGHDVEYAM